MNTLKKLYVHEVKGKLYIFDEITKYVRTGEVIDWNGIQYKTGAQPSKIMKLKDFYKKHGKSLGCLEMLYPEVYWKKYQEYFEEFDNDQD